jgi:CRISPR-associated endonuclease Csn1
MTKVLGLDVGMASVGFSLIFLEKNEIKTMGVHLFEAAENPKDGASLSGPRREARGKRRVIRRRAVRKKSLYKLFENQGFRDIEQIFDSSPDSPWELRRVGLEKLLTDFQFSRALYHICKHRGFKSNRKSKEEMGKEGKDKEGEEYTKMLKATTELETDFKKSGHKTIGSYLSVQNKKRNYDGDYSHTVLRSQIREEIDVLFDQQRTFGNPKATNELQQQVKDIVLFQRPLKSVEHMRGYCTFFEKVKRAPKFSNSAENFVFFSKLNNLKLLTTQGLEKPITLEMREKLFEKALSSKEVKFTHIRKLWGLEDDVRFNFVKYKPSKKKKDSDEPVTQALSDLEKGNFFEFKGYYTLAKTISAIDKKLWADWKDNSSLLDYISEVVSFEFDEEIVKKRLRKHEILKTASEEIIEALAGINTFSKTVNLSLKAINRLLPYLKNGKRYDEAVKLAQEEGKLPTPKKKKLNLLPPLEKTNNPVVDRAVSQARKVVNAVIRRFGLPEAIHIELARELGKSKKLRNEIEKIQKDNKQRNDGIKEEIRRGFNHEASKDDVVKYKLWQDQKGCCAYSGEYIDPSRLFSSDSEVDHILPYSRSYDDSYMNKVLAFTKYNREKGNKYPYEKWGATDNWLHLEAIAQNFPFQKRCNFLLKNFEDVENEWKARHLNDTRYMATHLKDHIRDNLGQVKVFTISGGVTNHLRHSWGLGQKDRETDNKHHAVDAAIIACATPACVQAVTNFNKRYEFERWKKQGEEGEKPRAPQPWEGFREKVAEHLKEVFVSRMPNRKVIGQAHMETIKSIRVGPNEENLLVKRIKLESVKKDQLEKMVDKQRNIKLYEVLKQRLESFNNDPKKAFAKPVYMPRNNGTEGPVVNGIRIYDDSKSGINIRQGHADNGDMVRVDVFSKADKKGKCQFYLSPIYVMDVLKGELPNKVFISKDFKPIDETYHFEFSLHKGDYVILEKNNGEREEGYYVGFHRGTGSINILKHQNNPDNATNGLGVKTLKSFKKYAVNYSGERFLVKGEKQQHFKKAKN